MSWSVEYTNEFGDWWENLSVAEQRSVAVVVDLLSDAGPRLSFPHSSQIKSSKHSHMRELRIQHKGSPYRILYAFDPLRNAILLIGGNKRGNDRWYESFIPIADKLYDEHVDELSREGKNNG